MGIPMPTGTGMFKLVQKPTTMGKFGLEHVTEVSTTDLNQQSHHFTHSLLD